MVSHKLPCRKGRFGKLCFVLSKIFHCVTVAFFFPFVFFRFCYENVRTDGDRDCCWKFRLFLVLGFALSSKTKNIISWIPGLGYTFSHLGLCIKVTEAAWGLNFNLALKVVSKLHQRRAGVGQVRGAFILMEEKSTTRKSAEFGYLWLFYMLYWSFSTVYTQCNHLW